MRLCFAARLRVAILCGLLLLVALPVFAFDEDHHEVILDNDVYEGQTLIQTTGDQRNTWLFPKSSTRAPSTAASTSTRTTAGASVSAGTRQT